MKNKKGFTLVELIVVIAVLAILAILAVVAFRGVQASAAESALRADAERIADHLNMYLSATDADEAAATARLGTISSSGVSSFTVEPDITVSIAVDTSRASDAAARVSLNTQSGTFETTHP